jgi:hypothetical protein
MFLLPRGSVSSKLSTFISSPKRNKVFLAASTINCCFNGFLFLGQFKLSPEMEFLDIKFNKRLEFFAPCFSQYLLQAVFKGSHAYSCLVLKILTKKSAKQGSFHEKHFVERKNEDRKPDKNSSLGRLKFVPRNIK